MKSKNWFSCQSRIGEAPVARIGFGGGLGRFAHHPLHRGGPEVQVAGPQPALGLDRPFRVGEPVFADLGQRLDDVARLSEKSNEALPSSRGFRYADAALPASSTTRARLRARASGSLTA